MRTGESLRTRAREFQRENLIALSASLPPFVVENQKWSFTKVFLCNFINILSVCAQGVSLNTKSLAQGTAQWKASDRLESSQFPQKWFYRLSLTLIHLSLNLKNQFSLAKEHFSQWLNKGILREISQNSKRIQKRWVFDTNEGLNQGLSFIFILLPLDLSSFS